MRGNKLEKSHIIPDFILDSLFVNKLNIPIGLFDKEVGVTWRVSDTVKN